MSCVTYKGHLQEMKSSPPARHAPRTPNSQERAFPSIMENAVAGQLRRVLAARALRVTGDAGAAHQDARRKTMDYAVVAALPGIYFSGFQVSSKNVI